VVEVMLATGQQVIPAPAAEVVVLAEAEREVEAAEVARICRQARSTVADYEPRSLRAKMRSADKLGALFVVLLSAEDAAARRCQLRHMASGEQQALAWDELPERLA